MPKGIPNKKEMEVKDVKVFPKVTIEKPMKVETKPEVKDEAKEETKVKTEDVVLKGCNHSPNCQCKDALAPGQSYFEDGPTGTIIIGDETKNEVWFRGGNNGKGCFINKKR